MAPTPKPQNPVKFLFSNKLLLINQRKEMGTTGSAGAIYCCSQDERKNNFKGYINNLKMTGIDGLGDLEDVECA